MALPKIVSPTFKIVLPSNNKEVWIRPFKVREEKILLIAQQSEDEDEQIRAIKQIISNCIVDPEDFNVDSLASFDIEYIFIKLRAKSVGEIVKLNLIPQNREGLPAKQVEFNLDELMPVAKEGHTNKITLESGLVIQMSYPTFATIRTLGSVDDNIESLFKVFQKSITKIYDGDEVYDTKDSTDEEMQEFVEDLNTADFQSIQEFFNTMPRIERTFVYEWTNPEDNSDTHKEEIVLRGMLSFLS